MGIGAAGGYLFKIFQHFGTSIPYNYGEIYYYNSENYQKLQK